jgi:hypothetical protein
MDVPGQETSSMDTHRACLDEWERERESAKLLLFCTFFALLDPNTPKCKRANATVILLIMD